jgi:hypothetical protein
MTLSAHISTALQLRLHGYDNRRHAYAENRRRKRQHRMKENSLTARYRRGAGKHHAQRITHEAERRIVKREINKRRQYGDETALAQRSILSAGNKRNNHLRRNISGNGISYCRAQRCYARPFPYSAMTSERASSMAETALHEGVFVSAASAAAALIMCGYLASGENNHRRHAAARMALFGASMASAAYRAPLAMGDVMSWRNRSWLGCICHGMA